MTSLKILNLQIENVKRITAVEISPNGNLIEITGKNAAGKTTVLDCIWWALKGKSAIQSDPIRHGENEASIKLDLGEFIITRTFNTKGENEYTTKLVVTAADGSLLARPQEVIDALYGNLTFDPLNFMRMRPAEQLEMMKEYVEDIDFKAIDSDHDIDYDRRQEINREYKSTKARADAIVLPDDCPEKVVLDQIFTDMREAVEHNSKIDSRQTNRENLAGTIALKTQHSAEKSAQADELRSRVTILEQEANQLLDEAKEAQAVIDAADELPPKIDIEEIQAKLDAAEEINNQAYQKEFKDIYMQTCVRLKAASDKLTKSIEDRKAATKKAIKSADMPVDGLDFGEACILYNDVPFDQASSAEQLRVSMMMAIAMNPTLRVLRVQDGSLLDEDAMKMLAEIADEQDYQFWIERVDNTGQVGFVIEDGGLKTSGSDTLEN